MLYNEQSKNKDRLDKLKKIEIVRITLLKKKDDIIVTSVCTNILIVKVRTVLSIAVGLINLLDVILLIIQLVVRLELTFFNSIHIATGNVILCDITQTLQFFTFI